MMVLKGPPTAARRLPDGAAEPGHDHDHDHDHEHEHEHEDDQLVIRLPDPRVLRLVARSVLLAAALLSLPWIRAVMSPPIADPAPTAYGSRWIDDPFFLPMLLRDLQRHGLLKPDGCAVFLGDASSRLPILRRSGVAPVAERQKAWIPDRSVDFVLAADGFGDPSFAFVDRVLRIGGVTAVRLGSDPSESFHLPPNYRMAYIRRFGSTVVAIRKIAPASEENGDGVSPAASSGMGRRLLAVSEENGDGVSPAASSGMGRRLLAVPAARKAALDRLEGAMLEPQQPEARKRTTRYLPELTGDSLDGYSRRVLVDVESPGRAGIADWFAKQYPKKGGEFEIVKLEAVDREEGSGGVAEWLSRNVREEEFVVMKAEVGVAEEVLAAGAAGLVDELFLECENQWENGRSRRAYWECVAVYGRFLDEGVAVHQWWG